jgi:hypothetical protein
MALEPICRSARRHTMQPYPYIHINADGTARELHASERA